MSLISAANAFVARNSRSGSYQIEQSLRFNSADSAYLTRTVSTNGNGRTFTISLWFKKGKSSVRHAFYGAGDTSVPSVGGFWFRLDSQERLWAQGGGGTTVSVSSADLFRDHSAWYHFVCAVDTTQSTSSNRVKLYVNGQQISSFNSTSYPSQDYQFDVNLTNASQQIGRANDSNIFAYYVDGYVAEYHLLDGTQASASDFGKYNNNGVWVPKQYTGSHGTNGFYLNFSNSSNLGEDQAGSNDWTANNFTTSGTGTDVMSDTPTTNWATLNALAKGSPLTLSNGNLSLTGGHGTTTSTIAVTAGMKAYMEYQFSSSFSNGNDAAGFGVAQRTDPFSSYPGAQSNVWWVYQSNQWYIRPPIGGASYGYKALSGNTVQIAIDYDAGKVWIGINNTWYDQSNGSSGDPAAGTGEMFSTTFTDSVHFFIHSATSTVNSVNFGQRDFAYTPPTDFLPLNTANLPAPDIADGSQYFDTVTYSGATSGTAGSGTTQAVTGLGFSPDLVWIKNRSNSNSHGLFDQVRGAVNALRSDLTAAEATTNSSGALSAFDSNGFTLANGSSGSDQAILTHQSGYTYVAWNWLASNTSGSSNTDGSITSTVSANPSAGFSIVSYTGNGVNGATIGHGLGVEPAMIIVKERVTSPHSGNWFVWHKNLSSQPANFNLNNDTSSAPINATGQGGMASAASNPSSVFQIYTGVSGVENANRNTATYIAYCFAEIEGYSKFGSFVGNGSADGPFVFCGFRPAYVWLKGSTFASNWNAYDSARDQYNITDDLLRLNSAAAEVPNYGATAGIDLLSNGFKIRTSSGDWNSSGQTFVFCAFAENPFGGDGVSPVTAR